ncbi:MipA/OmpV family protein [Aliiglaciecola sp. CAU 1673]|uniref:MipA/OmpV family protein n=1 Tax=Aliiglaciecola sp. CAU 1673 TaxID=3032595 RepID=UPI0023DCDD4A|nr:MipA/OmpV family protein [Aliiglaciecola sp. CAU 1673]MDF2177362.1 MipA/OmpV family protein [Aliiglaciecola sp. CAU 1673]
MHLNNSLMLGVLTLLSLTCYGAQWSAGVGVVATGSLYQGESSNVFVVPLIQYQGERFKFQGVEASYRLVGDKNWSIEATLGPGFDNFDPDEADAAQMKTISKRDFSILAGLKVNWHLGSVTAELAAGQDISGHSKGMKLDGSVKRRYQVTPSLFVIPAIGLEYLDAESSDYYYGVDAGESPFFSPYQAGSAYNPYLAVTLLYGLSPSWQIFSMLKVADMDSSITHSPIVDDDMDFTGVAALTYTF